MMLKYKYLLQFYRNHENIGIKDLLFTCSSYRGYIAAEHKVEWIALEQWLLDKINHFKDWEKEKTILLDSDKAYFVRTLLKIPCSLLPFGEKIVLAVKIYNNE